MNSESVAGVLAAIVASIVLVIAIAYGPIGQFGKPTKPRQKSSSPPNAAPAVRGPVVREVPQKAAQALRSRLQDNFAAPLAKPPDRPYIASNGDVDAS